MKNKIMAMAQAVLGGRGLHLQCCSTSSFSARSLTSVRHLSAAGFSSVVRFLLLLYSKGGEIQECRTKGQIGFWEVWRPFGKRN